MCLHSCWLERHQSRQHWLISIQVRSQERQTRPFINISNLGLPPWGMNVYLLKSILKRTKKVKTNTNEKRMADLAATKLQWIRLSGCQTLASLPSTTKMSANFFAAGLTFILSLLLLLLLLNTKEKISKDAFNLQPTAANYWKWNRNGVSSHVLSSHLIIALQKWLKNDKTLQVQADTASRAPNAPRTTTTLFTWLVRLQI